MDSALERRTNDALHVNGNSVNGKTVAIAITTHGSDVYWAVTAVMVCATFAFIGLAATKPRSHRIFHYITAAITLVASIAYFSMGSNLGWTPIDVEFHRSDPTVHGMNREIFYVRYIDWFITTPLLLLDLLLTAALPWPTIMFIILIDEVMIVTGLVGALVRSSYKWGYFAFGCAALCWIIYILVWEARRNANAMGKDVGRAFLYCGSLTTILWTLYPIAWGVCEGGNVIPPDSEAVFYGVLDCFAKPVFGALLLWGHRGIDPARLGLQIRDYGEQDAIFKGKGEKGHLAGSNGVGDGTTNGATNDAAATGATTGAVAGGLTGTGHHTGSTTTGDATGAGYNNASSTTGGGMTGTGHNTSSTTGGGMTGSQYHSSSTTGGGMTGADYNSRSMAGGPAGGLLGGSDNNNTTSTTHNSNGTTTNTMTYTSTSGAHSDAV